MVEVSPSLMSSRIFLKISSVLEGCGEVGTVCGGSAGVADGDVEGG